MSGNATANRLFATLARSATRFREQSTERTREERRERRALRHPLDPIQTVDPVASPDTEFKPYTQEELSEIERQIEQAIADAQTERTPEENARFLEDGRASQPTHPDPLTLDAIPVMDSERIALRHIEPPNPSSETLEEEIDEVNTLKSRIGHAEKLLSGIKASGKHPKQEIKAFEQRITQLKKVLAQKEQEQNAGLDPLPKVKKKTGNKETTRNKGASKRSGKDKV